LAVGASGRQRDRLAGAGDRRADEHEEKEPWPESPAHGGLLPDLQVDVLDHVAEVAGGIPERLAALRLADPVERAHHDARRPRLGRRPGGGPLAERVAAEIAAEVRAPPRGAAIRRNLHLLDAVAAVEGDALERDGPADGQTGARNRRGDER